VDIEAGRLVTEIAHVLFMDMVGFSTLPLETQSRHVRELHAIVRAAPEVQRAEARGELLSIDTGDGMALVFFRDPVGPVQCALEVARALRSHPHIRLRMGVHSGPVSRAPDIQGKETVTGGGINTAQRVMDCGDAGHILLSRTSAEVMTQFSAWTERLADLGECVVKHGVKVHVFNLVADDAGNAAVPRAVAVSAAPALSAPAPQAVSSDSPVVALLYRRNTQPDEQLLKYLETELSAAGFHVFIDRHMSIGVEWATEIERQITGAAAVVPLLSQASMWSEMLDHEVQTAHRAAQTGGKPRILPVRVAYDGALPDSLAAVLDRLNYFHWTGPEDNARLAAELIQSLRNPPAPSFAREKLEAVGGAVPLDSRFYVVRPTDEEFKTAIARRDSIVLVKGGRQMGKTSLLARGLQMAREQGARVVLTDFQTFNAAHLESPEALYLTLAEMIADQLDLDVFPQEVWNASRGPNMNLERYLRREVFGTVEQPIVWAMDEVDRLFSCDFGSEVFGLFRSWHNRRSLDPAGPWSRLTLAIAYATEAHLFITDINQSPFNVGTRLVLDDFMRDEVAELNRRYGSPLRTPEELDRFHALIGGQPYLTQRGFTELVSRQLTVTRFEEQADRDDGLFGDHLRRILVTLSQDPDMTEVVRGFLRGEPIPTPEYFYRLRSGGLLSGGSAADACMRCRLYHTYLTRHLL
jgi:class 3 adenylate cyclase